MKKTVKKQPETAKKQAENVKKKAPKKACKDVSTTRPKNDGHLYF